MQIQRLALIAMLVASAPLLAQTGANPRVDAIFAAFDKRDTPGCAVSVSEGDRTTFAKGYGYASLEHDLPITPTTAFYAASVSKQFTAFAVALLSTQGKLSLDDDIRKYIPEVPDFGKTVTIRHLIHHTSGLRDYFGLLGMTDWPGDGPLSEAKFLDLVSRQRSLNFEPGARHLYSNTGYVLLSILVKRASGKSLREFADERMFKPLGMTSTRFRDDHTMLVKHRALAYAPRQEEWVISMPGFDVVGDGGLFTTVEDLAKWARSFEGNALTPLVHTRGRLANGDSIPYAFGLTLGEFRGLATVEHGGAYGGYRTNILRFPVQRVAIALLCNAATVNTSGLSRQVAEVVLGDRLAAVPVRPQLAGIASEPVITLSREKLEKFAGAYWDASNEVLARFEMRGDNLVQVSGQVPLQPVAENRFRPATAPTVSLTFTPASDGGMQLTIGNQSARRMSPPRTDASTLASYSGDYHSDELDVTWTIAKTASGLVVRRRALVDLPITPVFIDAFQSPAGVMRFVHDASGRVTGFVVGAGRVTGFKFTKGPS